MTFAFEFQMIWRVVTKMFQTAVREKTDMLVLWVVEGYRSMSFTAGLRFCLTVTSWSIWMGERARWVLVVVGRVMAGPE